MPLCGEYYDSSGEMLWLFSVQNIMLLYGKILRLFIVNVMHVLWVHIIYPKGCVLELRPTRSRWEDGMWQESFWLVCIYIVWWMCGFVNLTHFRQLTGTILVQTFATKINFVFSILPLGKYSIFIRNMKFWTRWFKYSGEKGKIKVASEKKEKKKYCSFFNFGRTYFPYI